MNKTTRETIQQAINRYKKELILNKEFLVEKREHYAKQEEHVADLKERIYELELDLEENK